MRKLLKKIFVVFLATIILVSGIPAGKARANESKQTDNAKYLELSDEYINVTVSKENGGFTISTVKGDKLKKSDDNKYLLYPSADYDTSYTSIRVTKTDGSVKDYIFGRDYGFLGLDSSDVTLSKQGNNVTALWSVNDITIEQRLSLLDESATQHGMVSISYSFTTERDDIANIQARIMLDTALGYQDYGVYQMPNEFGEYAQIESEALLENDQNQAYSGAMFAVDNANMPKITAYTVNTTMNGQTLSPDKVAIGHWNNLASTVFDFVPDAGLTFTNSVNAKYMTADSAYALYYDMGALAKGDTAEISTYYGVYSNSTVGEEEKAAVNFQLIPGSMTLNESKDGYLSQVEGGRDGDIKVDFSVENLSGNAMDSMTVVVKTQNKVIPYESYYSDVLYDEDSLEDYVEVVDDVKPGEVVPLSVYFNVRPLAASEYRRFEVLCYDAKKGETLTEEKLLGTREFYLMCPGVLGEVVTFNSIDPQMIYTDGTRHVYLSGQNFMKISKPNEYTTYLRPLAGGNDVMVPATNVVVDTEKNTMHLIVDQTMKPGGYQVVFDWIEGGKEDTTSEMLQFQVTDRPEYIAPTYGIVTVEKASDYDQSTGYVLATYLDENDYKKRMRDANNKVLLEFRGDFSLVYDDAGNVVGAKAVSIADVEGKVTSTINISNCLDVEAGNVDLVVENPGQDNQAIHVNIDGKVYTTNARTKVWDGVCAISSFENGNESTLLQYDADGDPTSDIENSVANTNAITLLWPGAAGTAQTLAGVIMEFRYAQFGMMALEEGDVTDSTPKRRVIAFGAEMSPDFLLPSNFKYDERQTSTMEVVQLKMAKSNYTAEQLRDVQKRYAQDQADWEEAESGSLSLYVHDILFGGGFIGFHASVDVGIPSYADGLPGIEGTLDMHIMPMDKKWEVGVAGSADFGFVQMEANLALKAYNGIPIADTIYFYIGGVTPGINVDGMGIFWIRGLGGGMDNLYDSLFVSSTIPPITLMLSGEFALFTILEAKADLNLSMRGFDVSLSDVGVAGINLIDYVGMSAYWYPKLKLNAKMEVSILDVIEGGGYIVVEENSENGDIFWEGFVTASVKTPEIPLIGSITIGSADLGVNAAKIWGALHVLKMDMSLTYYWGGDVDFAFGKYDATEPTLPTSEMALMSDVPVYTDEETGKILYMSIGTNAVLAAEAEETEDAAPVVKTRMMRRGMRMMSAKIESASDRTYHAINLGAYTGQSDQALSFTFEAENQAEAERIAKSISLKNEKNEVYPLLWLDTKVDALMQENANALISYDAETKQASVLISFTEESHFIDENGAMRTWSLTTEVPSDPVLYTMRHLPGMDKVTYEYKEAESKISVKWEGSQFDRIEQMAVYAVAEDGNTMYTLWEMENTTGVELADDLTNPVSGGTEITIPDSLPSGTYSIRAVASGERSSVNDIVDAVNVNGGSKFTWSNPKQPRKPEILSVKTGGDYSLDVQVKAKGMSDVDNGYDGYIATVYEMTGTNQISGEGIWKATDFASQWIAADRSETDKNISLGGSYTMTAKVDGEGNIIDPAKARSTDQTKEVTYGLEAGKTYRVGVCGYRTESTGVAGEQERIYTSEEVFSEPVVMTTPEPANLTIKAQGTVQTEDVMAGQDGTLDTVNKEGCVENPDGSLSVAIDITSDKAVTGTWTLDSNIESGTFTVDAGQSTQLVLKGRQTSEDYVGDMGLTEGEHTLELQGETTKGDSFRETYRFRVDTTAPSLLLQSPSDGAFFGENAKAKGGTFIGTILTGTSEPNTEICVFVEGKAMNGGISDSEGNFNVEIPLDGTKVEQEIEFYAVDEAGNEGRHFVMELTNELVGAKDVELAIFLNGENFTNKAIPAGLDGQLELRMVSGDKSLVIPADNNIGRQAEWNLLVVDGNATLNGNLLESDTNANGMITVTLDQSQANAQIGGVGTVSAVNRVNLPTGGNGYSISTADNTLVNYGDSFTFSVNIANGYSKLSNFAVRANGVRLTQNADGTYTVPKVKETLMITVEGVADITAPGMVIEVGGNSFKEFLNTITFSMFFKKSQTVTLTASEMGSGIKEISYYLSNKQMSLEEIQALPDDEWTEYTKAFNLNPDSEYIIYVRARDNAGNTTWCSSDGMVIDGQSPKIQGAEDGATYYGDQTFYIKDGDIVTLTVDGIPMLLKDGKFTIKADNQEHTIEAVDKYGNATLFTIFIGKQYTVKFVAGTEVLDERLVNHGSKITADEFPDIPSREGYDEVPPVWEVTEIEEVTEDMVIKVLYTENAKEDTLDDAEPSASDLIDEEKESSIFKSVWFWLVVVLAAGGIFWFLILLFKKKKKKETDTE